MNALSLIRSFVVSARLAFVALPGFVIGLNFAPAHAQGGNGHVPSYPNVAAAAPVSDFTPVANGAWPDFAYAAGLGGTCEARFQPLHDCVSFRLVYANSTLYESGDIKNNVTIRAALYVKRPNRPVIVRQVTFHNGATELTLTPESMAVSDSIPEYWAASEKATVFVRTFAQVAQVGEQIPYRSSWQGLSGFQVKMVTGTTDAPDLTMAAPDDARFVSAPWRGAGFSPVAILGETSAGASSVAILGSSSVAATNSYAALAAKRAGIPYLLLSAGGTTAADYGKFKLRPHLDAICSHALVYYGRNDIGFALAGNIPPGGVLSRVEGDMSSLWQRLKVQGAWVGAMTVTPRDFGGPFTDPTAQKPSSAEMPLRLPLNDWIRSTVLRAHSPLDRVYETADAVEFFEGGLRTSKWNYGLDKKGNRVSLTADGLHPSAAGADLLSRLILDADFVYRPADYVCPIPADAFVRGDGSRIVVHFNDAKNPPLLVPDNAAGFTVRVNGALRRVVQAQQTGPKEIALTLGGASIKKGDVALVDYSPGSATPLVDSSARHNPVEAFADFPVDNRMKDAGENVLSSRLALSDIQWTREGNFVKALVRFANDGGANADNVYLTAAKLGGVGAKASFPLSLGGMPSGANVALTLIWLAPVSGTQTTLRISGADAAGRFTSSARVIIP